MDAFIDCSLAGASGDMLVAALVDAGAPPRRIKKSMEEAAKPFGGAEVEIRRVRVNEIKATRLEVKTQDKGGRTYRELVEGVKSLGLEQAVESGVLRALEALARAEARVHGKGLAELKLHEVGAADAVSDLVGCFTAAHELGLLDGEILASEVAVGRGITKLSHGEIPLPPPATLEILKGVPLRGKPLEAELTTPTGAALLKALAKRFIRAFPPMLVKAIGYGAGKRELRGTPNLLRACLGELRPPLEEGEVAVLETHVDDVRGDQLSHAVERLMEEGALDASVTPMLMKKGRPGFLIRVISRPEDLERLAGVLMLHTGTLGVRFQTLKRLEAKRELVPVKVKVGEREFKARAKVARVHEHLLCAAEFEDAKRISELAGISVKEAMGLVEEAARRRLKRSS